MPEQATCSPAWLARIPLADRRVFVAGPTQRVLGGCCEAVINVVQRAFQAASTAISRVSSQGA